MITKGGEKLLARGMRAGSMFDGEPVHVLYEGFVHYRALLRASPPERPALPSAAALPSVAAAAPPARPAPGEWQRVPVGTKRKVSERGGAAAVF